MKSLASETGLSLHLWPMEIKYMFRVLLVNDSFLRFKKVFSKNLTSVKLNSTFKVSNIIPTGNKIIICNSYLPTVNIN